jgi:hypothetical protein
VLLCNLCFFTQHQWNFVSDWVNATARDTLQPGFVGQEFHARFASWANQDVEGVFWNIQPFLPGNQVRIWCAKYALYQTPSTASNSPTSFSPLHLLLPAQRMAAGR